MYAEMYETIKHHLHCFKMMISSYPALPWVEILSWDHFQKSLCIGHFTVLESGQADLIVVQRAASEHSPNGTTLGKEKASESKEYGNNVDSDMYHLYMKLA